MSSYVDYHRFRGESCTEEGCRSKKYYIEDGKKFCEKGHEQIGFTQTQQDEDDYPGNQGKKSRKVRVQKEKVEKVLSGRDATDHYLQCYQLILWKQVHWLINSKGFTPELEVVVKDLWGLRIQGFQKDEEMSVYGSTMFSSQSEADGSDTDGTGAKSTSSRRSRMSVVHKQKLPKLIETLGLCYLGMLLLRLPVSLGEIYKWAAKEEMVYARAIKEIPKEMRMRLRPEYYAALEIRAELKGSRMYRTILNLVEFYHSNFEMESPPLNAPILIFNHIRDLALPIEIYPAVRRLSTLLNFNFTYPIRKTRVHEIKSYPEIQIISMIVLATKLTHPFDSISRVPENDIDPTVLRIDWKQWTKSMQKPAVKGLRKGDEIKVTDGDVLGMSARKIDDYLDWYQRTWMDDRDPKVAEQILELFPVSEPPPRAIEDVREKSSIQALKEIQQNLIFQTPKTVDEDEGNEIRRPGEFYRKYRKIEDLPESARAFYERAAENAGISLEMLVRGVVQLEALVEAWNLADRKRRLLDEQEDMGLSEGDD